MAFEEWYDLFNFRFGPLRMGFGAPFRPCRINYSRTKDTHILRLKLDPEPKKEDIKVRFLKGGILEIEWPRITEGEEIEIE